MLMVEDQSMCNSADLVDVRSNLSLDKSLHSLLMTSLIPNAHEASRPVEKRNQMSSRLLEVSHRQSGFPKRNFR